MVQVITNIWVYGIDGIHRKTFQICDHAFFISYGSQGIEWFSGMLSWEH